MSVVTFYGNDKVETAQSTTMAAIATYLAFQQDFKILMINTKYNDISIEECFWEKSTNEMSDLETGISGLIKAISSNKTSPEIITNYTKTIFKGRLELLTDNNILMENYEKQKGYLKSIIRMAIKYYDLVFIDLEGSLEDLHIQSLLEESNLIVANTTQRIKVIKSFLQARKTYDVLKKNNIMYLLGKYDKYSKYNVKNLQRAEKISDVYGIPYNTMFFEASNEGKLADFIIKYRGVKQNSIQAPIMNSISEVGQRIIDKLKELQMQI